MAQITLLVNGNLYKKPADMRENISKVLSVKNPFATTPVSGALAIGKKINPADPNEGLMALVAGYQAGYKPDDKLQVFSRPDSSKNESDNVLVAETTIKAFANILSLIAHRADYEVTRPVEKAEKTEKTEEEDTGDYTA